MSRFRSLEFEGGPDGQPEVPQRGEAWCLGEAQRAFEQGDFERALRFYARTLEENPRSAAAWAGQLRMLLELSRLTEADAWSGKALEVHPGHPEILAARAIVMAHLSQSAPAIALSDASLAESTSVTPFLWLARAEVLLTFGEGPADFCIDRALAMAEGDWVPLWLAARVRVRHGHYASALGLLQRALLKDASRPVLWVQRGECEIALGQLDAGRRSLQHALDLQPQNPEARRAMTALGQAGLAGRLGGLWRRMRGG
jgi:tetratricopeptide (TPR) repeat protein